jgi:mannitol/fructose-specific phosphotransferase system IIA component (Ntr-type)
MKRLQDALDRNHILLDLSASDIDSAFRKTIEHLVTKDILPAAVADEVITALLKREQEAPTAIGHAAAIPHTYLEGIEEQVVAFVRLKRPVNLGALDRIPTRFLFFLLGPPNAASQHLDTLASVARLMSDDEFRYELGEARSREDLRGAFEHFTARTSPQELGEVESEGLEYTGKIAGGVRNDIARRWPHYISDFVDGFNAKCLASTLFLFFACLAPAVTFGGVMAVQTDGHIGAVEMILASAFCGVMFAIFSGTPLIILGGTGPLLVFTAILYQLCNDMEIPFLSTYAWVGLWSAGFLLILSVTDASCLMRFFTRFTDEIFSALISISTYAGYILPSCSYGLPLPVPIGPLSDFISDFFN